MDDKLVLDSRAQIAAIKRNRATLLDQIRESQETIQRSRELLRRIDELLAKSSIADSDGSQ